uniref:Glyoxylate reductase/hydroxypyruvate reductase n=1 Tax=Syphacia muris TaxID=451379 RepID=A0A0N5B121_9BILA
MPPELLMAEIPKFEGLFCLLRDKIDKALLDRAEKLKVISTMSVGYDHIDINECKKRGIIVTITPDVLTETTAETTVALLLATARRFPEAIRDAKMGGWGTWEPFYMSVTSFLRVFNFRSRKNTESDRYLRCGVGVRDSVVGIIGFGRIGQSVAQKIASFNPSKILYYDPHPNEKAGKISGVQRVSMDELLAESDFVCLNCAATKENKEMMNKTTLNKMKDDAVLINTSRGTLIDQNALYEALKYGKIRAAGLDVTTPEPLPIDSPLFKLDNCVILPHIGSSTVATRTEMMKLAEDSLFAGLTGAELPPRVRVA